MKPYLPKKPPDKPPVTLQSYVKTIRRSGLLDTGAVEAALDELAHTPGPRPQSVELARRLEQQGLLTPWQNGWLLAGEHQRLTFGPYKLLERISSERGYLAEHREEGTRVALKILSAEGRYAERLALEVQSIARLQHAHLLRLIQAGQVDTWHFLAFEPARTDLQQLVDRWGPLAYDRAARYIQQAADGLAHAHAQGVVHHDIKPSELLLAADGAIRIDVAGWKLFAPERDLEVLEHQENVLGTTDYLAPFPALDSHSVDPRCDVYSLGCTLYFLLTGHPPFTTGTLAQRLMKHQTEDPPAITIDRPDCPADLIEICLRMKAVKPVYTAAKASQALAEWLARYERGEVTPPPPATAEKTKPAENRPEEFPPIEPVASVKRRRSWWLW